MSRSDSVLYQATAGIGILTINRPASLNALDEGLLLELKLRLNELERHNLTGLILTGAGDKAFIAGADIKAMSNMKATAAQTFSRLGHSVALQFERLPFPVIAAVNGYALGGGFEMALACDMIFASEKAVFGLPEVKLGLMPGFGGTQRLARRTSAALAKELIFSGRNMRVSEAKEKGIVQQLFADQQALLTGAQQYLQEVGRNSPLAIRVAKAVVNRGNELGLEQGLELELHAFSQLFSSHDMNEGTAAFLAKRPAAFKGE